MTKSPDAFRTISEVAELLHTPAHVLRFWETRFPQIRPVKRAGGRRYYRPADVALLISIKKLLHEDGLTIRGVQKLLREQGVRQITGLPDDVDAAEEAFPLAEDTPAEEDFPVEDEPEPPIPPAPMIEEPEADAAVVPPEEDEASETDETDPQAPLEKIFARLMPEGLVPPAPPQEAEATALPPQPDPEQDIDPSEAPIALWVEDDDTEDLPSAPILFMPAAPQETAQALPFDLSNTSEAEMILPDFSEAPVAVIRAARQVAQLRALRVEMLSVESREDLTCLRDLAQQLLGRLAPAVATAC